jgi:outer membrane immunogenic protein
MGKSMNTTVKSSLGFLALAVTLLIVSGRPAAAQSDSFDHSTAVSKTMDDPADTRSAPDPTPSPTPARPLTWTGGYVGGSIGGNFGKAIANTSTAFTPTGYFNTVNPPVINAAGRQSLSPSGFNVGALAGYNFQSGRHIVVGVEADFGWMSSKSSATVTSPYAFPSGTFTITQSLKTNLLLTARGRAGYLWRNFLFYGTGGLAAANINYQTTFTDTFAAAAESGSVKNMRTGWTGGIGAEYKLGEKWSIKLEGLHADLGRATTTSTNLVTSLGTTNAFTHSIYIKEQIVRLGLNYHF